MNTDIDYTGIRPDRKSDEPLHIQLHRALVREIRSLPPNRHVALMSERELAIRLNLSRRTTHRAYEQLLEDRLVRRRPDKSLMVRQDARSRMLGPYPVIGVLIPMDFSQFVQNNGRNAVPYLEGLIGCSSGLNASCIMLRSPEASASPAEIEAFAAEHFHRLCGVIHLGGLSRLNTPCDPVLEQIMKHTEIPQVCISGSLPEDHVGSVCADPAQGLDEMCQVLTERGFRRVGVIGRKFEPQRFHYIAEERSSAMCDALTRNGLECVLRADLPDTGTGAAVEAILTSPDRPEVLLCHNDKTADLVWRTARSMGLRIPDDLALAGYDCRPGDPRLASIMTSPGDIASAAVEMVMDHFRNGISDANRLRLLPTKFVDGRSLHKPGVHKRSIRKNPTIKTHLRKGEKS